MKTDYTIMCSCGREEYANTLLEARAIANGHVNQRDDFHEVYIDRNRDKEIDDSFKSIRIATPPEVAISK